MCKRVKKREKGYVGYKTTLVLNANNLPNDMDVTVLLPLAAVLVSSSGGNQTSGNFGLIYSIYSHVRLGNENTQAYAHKFSFSVCKQGNTD